MQRCGFFSIDRDSAVFVVCVALRLADWPNGSRLGQRAPVVVTVLGRTVNQPTVLSALDVLDQPKMARA